MSEQEKIVRDRIDGKAYWLDQPKNINLILKVFYVLCGLLFVLDFVIHRHTYLGWEKIPGFYAIFGFTACVLLVILAKAMRKVVMRKEDYYDVD